MAPEELKKALREQPFLPFRIIMTDGKEYDVRHPDLLWVGKHTAYVGQVGQLNDDALWERSTRIDVLHIIRVEPLPAPAPPQGTNGPA